MRDQFYSYLDTFNKITIIYPKKKIQNIKDKEFYVLVKDEMLELNIDKVEDLGREMKFSCSFYDSLALNIEHTIIDEEQNRSLLRTGAIVRSDLFEMLYYYSPSDLGATYSESATTFKVWSPVAKELEVELISPSGEAKYYDMVGLPRGIWSICINGNLDSYRYCFHVRIDDKFKRCLDPYAISSDANAQYNFVINPDKLYKFKYKKPEFSGKACDAVVYELHVRDFTIDKSINNPHAGKFIGLMEHCLTKDGHKTGIDYLKDLGVTHVQLQPIYDFGSVDELNPDKYYNWGYDPVQYNVPEGWYATNPNDPYSRINELRMLIDEFHHAGIRVIMDVVYNHVYDASTFSYNILVPGYFYHYDSRGMITNVSGCGNDVASNRKMVSKFILDSTNFWMKEYHLDGFRFDLMGLLDIETMNDVNMLVKAVDPVAVVYGEGWNMPAFLPDGDKANMNNHEKMPTIGFFNDRFRDTLKGSPWNHTLGFAAGGRFSFMDILFLVTGSSIDNYLLSSPGQSINYVECHDNYTFYDFVKSIKPDMPEAQIKDYAALALGMVIVSQGVPFIHAGQEFFRTKQGVENSYKSSDLINKVDWERCDQNFEYVEMLRDLISIRKENSAFRYGRRSQVKERIKIYGQEIDIKSVRLMYKGINNFFYVIIKNDYKYEYLDFKDIVTVIFDGRKKVSKICGSLELEKPGVYIVKKGR